ncbi:Na+/H+ antiporter NhaA [Nocardioides caldifontis]|uniref:Na+/H+ antiporter NhaA n=1 Tax=Nocardioides caldifontis TaxID=2588938 RepID=UPI0011DF8606|nr:Na+/H+ antiporter NhaA [Nocardioides caldifontis]
MSDKRLFLPTSTSDEESFLGRLLRQETVGGAVVLVAAVVAVVWANSPWGDAYESLRHLEIGPLDVEHWAADGALTLFFYVAGLELKREFVVGSLSRPADALVPIVAACAGVAVPAIIFVTVNSVAEDGKLHGWAIPAATDIAFALAVLAVVGSRLPSSLRAFLLTLAVVDDLVVIVIIAAFYTSELHLDALLVALGLLVVFALLQKYRGESWLWYVPLSIAIWWFTHDSGIHATIAGVAMGLLTRVKPDPGEGKSPAERLEHTLTPLSAGVAVPFFALMSAGVAVELGSDLFTDPVVIGVAAGLVLGKPIGVMLGAWGVTKLTRAELNPDLYWRDVVGVAVLAGVGFTVALLVADLSYDGVEAEHAKTAVLGASVVAALLASAVLHRRTHARGLAEHRLFRRG